jgi:TonB-dependent SusC/RagA subfamily outer membrane receptor
MNMKTKYLFLVLLSLFIFVLPVSGQKENKKKVLSGYVTDANRNPVPGAMILIDKKNTNILTDSKGFYKVKTKAGAQLLTVFTLTSGTGEAKIGGQTSINVSLNGIQNNQPEKPVAEERVNIGYGTAERKDINSQVNKVSTMEDKYASYSNIYDMLKGAVPGLQVIGKTITIQGPGSPNSNSQPLLVVDGTIVSTIDDIQPTQVKSVEVLKGASASIYGSRGANGVILIHLKGTSDRK